MDGGAPVVVQIADKFEHFLEVYRRPDGIRWGGQDLHDAAGGIATRSYLSNLRKGRVENPGLEKLRAVLTEGATRQVESLRA